MDCRRLSRALKSRKGSRRALRPRIRLDERLEAQVVVVVLFALDNLGEVRVPGQGGRVGDADAPTAPRLPVLKSNNWRESDFSSEVVETKEQVESS